MFPMPPKEQEVIVRAIVYSGRPDWRDLLEKNSERMPLRRPLIDDFLNGKRPALMDLPLHHGGSPGIYALWGYYVATGQHQPVIGFGEDQPDIEPWPSPAGSVIPSIRAVAVRGYLGSHQRLYAVVLLHALEDVLV